MKQRYNQLRSYGHPPIIAFIGSIPYWVPIVIGVIIGLFVL